jgi:type IV pilus assembly protein PilW
VRAGAEVQPYLVLDRGLDANGDGPDDAEELIVAEGIELFQVGFVMTNGALATRGTIPGTAIAFAKGAGGSTAGNNMTTLQFPGVIPAGQSEYRPTSWFGYSLGPPPAVQRMDDHQANVRAVRLVIVGRSPSPEKLGATAGILTPVLNMNVLPAWVNVNDNYARNRVETTILVRNMTSRGMNDF